MKILIVSPSLGMGGIARHLSVFAKTFADIGHEVLFISCININQFYQLPDDVKLYKAPYKRTKGFFNTFVFRPWLVFYLRKKIKQIQPDVILVFGDGFNPFVLLAATGTKTPVFIGDMTSPDYNYGIINRVLKRITYPNSAGIVCQTKFAEDYKLKQFGPKINTIVLDNPIREVALYEYPKQPMVLYVGRFAWEKAPDRLIKAYAMLNHSAGWKLVMAGDGPLLEKSKRLAKELHIEDRIDFLGKVEEVDKLYSKASIYVLPSVIEGFPNALCEAMVAGLPVICFDDFPSHEIITHNIDGIIIPGGKVEKLAEEIDRLIQDKSKRKSLGANAAKIRERFDPVRISKKLLDFMNESIKHKK